MKKYIEADCPNCDLHISGSVGGFCEHPAQYACEAGHPLNEFFRTWPIPWQELVDTDED